MRIKAIMVSCLLAASPLAAQTTPSSAVPATAPAAAAVATPPAARRVRAHPCAAVEYRHFDFWVGHWDVYGPAGKLVAHSLIENVYDGCGIRESWMPLGGTGGGSLSTYVPAKKQWEQFWIDSSNARVLFVGGWNGTAMVIQGVWPNAPVSATGPITRMTYSSNADGSVRQFGESSQDEGKTWAPAFDFTYRKAAA